MSYTAASQQGAIKCVASLLGSSRVSIHQTPVMSVIGEELQTCVPRQRRAPCNFLPVRSHRPMSTQRGLCLCVAARR